MKIEANKILFCLVLAVMMAMPLVGWGQQGYDYSGVFYIANRDAGNYSPTNSSNNYYLCPSTDTYAQDQPFLTTYKTNHAANSKWQVAFVITEDGVDYYTIYHVETSKYLTYNEDLVINNDARVRVHLQSDLGEDGNSLFFFTVGNNTSENNYNIVPKNDESMRSLNPAKNNYNSYAGQNNSSPGSFTNWEGKTIYCGGLIGVWAQNDTRGLWYLEDVYPRPTITYTASNNQITLTRLFGSTTNYELYDTDGNLLSSSSTTESPYSFELPEGARTIKATSTDGTITSKVATYIVAVQTTISDDKKRPYLVRNNDHPWTYPSGTEGVFYMIPGDVSGENVTVNTSSMPRPTMEWYFKDAGVESNIQYYYIVNVVQDNGNDLYLYRTDNNIYVKEFGEGGDRYKFYLIERTAGYNIVPKGETAKFLNKNSGNTSPNALNLDSHGNYNATNWNFVLKSELDDTAPFMVSDANVSYYKMQNYHDGNSGYFILSPIDPSSNVTTSADPETDAMKWYFEEAQASTPEDWLTYYHIRNATTRYYMYYNGNNPNNNTNSFNVSASIGATPDDYQFAMVKSPETGAYYIVPKPLKDNSLSRVYTLYRNNDVLRIGNNRTVNDITWTFHDPDTPFKCETPLIFYDVLTGNINITCATLGVTIYYQHYDSEPAPGDIPAMDPANVFLGEFLAESGYYKAIAVRSADGTDCSDAATSDEIGQFHCVMPIIRVSSENVVTITCETPGADIFYIEGAGDFDENASDFGGTPYSSSFTKDPETTVKAIAIKDNNWATRSAIAIYDNTLVVITSGDEITNMNGNYKIGDSFTPSDDPIGTEWNPFTGTLDGNFIEFELSHPLFSYVNGAVIKNLKISNASISTSSHAGAIANVAKGDSRIYNCGVLDGSVGGGGCVGGIVGLLDGSSRVINCYSYATITGGSHVGGIVGYNNGVAYWTKGSSGELHVETMVMNCMFYGDITGGSTVSPVYGGNNIDNVYEDDDSPIGLNTFNYYAYDKLKTMTINKYNCALAVEEKYLNRFEFYRLLLNSNKKLAALYATGNVANADQMAKWVLETADRSITGRDPYPYPILKAQGTYPSIINPDIANAPDSTAVGPNKGGKLGKTLSVTISGVGSNAPNGASITTSSLTLQRTDKDFDRFNFNYDKVQLPYYNDVGTGNYTGDRVVTGWKITAITAVPNDPYTSTHYPTTGITDYPYHNYADRKSSNKDLYSVSGRVFSQGAYFDVPYGVTSITIEPYWAKAAYIADPNYDVVYNVDYSGKQNVTQTGTQVDVNTTLFNGQKVETSITRALDYITNDLGGLGSTVYDNALVLVGNLHLNTVPLNGDRPFTMMSVDTDNDHEPDYSLIYHHIGRSNIAPIRFDFLTVPGTAQAQKPNGATLICNFTIFKTRGWFEVTNTAFMYSNQLEYENGDLGTGVTKIDAPLILLGGIFDQFVSTQSSTVDGHTIYIHVGGNVWIKEFGMGTHSDGSESTPHVPVSVTGGEFPGFYLTGTYNANAAVRDDNAECYISGGHFGELAGASLEQIGAKNTDKGNVRWQIYNADIDHFFGGGINDSKPVGGNITTEIFNSRVGTFCGGPKFGDMQPDKKVTTRAEGCVFDTYFGAGFGGNSYSRKKYRDHTNYDFNSWQNYYYKASDGTGDRGKYYNGKDTQSSQQGGGTDYGFKGPGVGTDFDYEFFVWSTGLTGARFFVKFVSFSLAQCNDVESTLKNCTVNENFYGGGSLGKVSGLVTSVLEDCSVNGNVFGAGFSATLQPIEVRDAGFTKIPKYNSASGMFEPGELSGTTTFEWEQVAEYPAEGGEGFVDGNHVKTTQNLSKTNLGAVSEVSLTIKGNSTVLGSVYGGGDESVVSGDVTVTVQGNANISGNVFGGGNLGSVGGYTTVDINGGTVTQDVYGGGALADVVGNTTVNIMGGTVSRDIYGGGLGRKADAGNGIEAVEAKVYGTATVNIGIGTVSSTDPFINEVTGLDGSATIGGNVYGCNNANGSPQEDVTVNVFQTAHTATNMASYIEDDADYAIANVFGGGNEADFSVTGKTAYVNIYTCENTIGRVFGGGNAAAAPHVATEIQGGRLGQVFGGGNGELGQEYGADIGDGVDLTIHGGNVGEFYGGSNQNGVLQGDINVDVVNNGPCQTIEINDFFCGGNFVDISGNLTTDITCSQGMEVNNLYGGCNQADISGYVVLNVYGGTYTNVFGGSRGTSQKAADIGGDVTLNLYGGTIENVFGGSNINGNIGGSITVNVLDIEGECPLNITNIYGGSNLTSYEPDDATITSPVVNVVHIRNGVGGNVYGGSKGEVGVTTNVVSNPLVNIGYDATSMDGYIPATYLSTYSGLLAAPRAIVAGSVFGGGDAAVVQGNTAIFLRNKAKVFGNVYGGGNMGEVLGDTKVIVNGSH